MQIQCAVYMQQGQLSRCFFTSTFSGQSCLESIGEIDVRSINESQYRQSILPGGYQAIVPSYRFNCSGNITEWTITVTQRDKYNLDLQVWRPSPTGDDTRRYVLIGQNSFNRHIPHWLPKNSSKLLGEIQATPRPEDQLQIEPGDMALKTA